MVEVSNWLFIAFACGLFVGFVVGFLGGLLAGVSTETWAGGGVADDE